MKLLHAFAIITILALLFSCSPEGSSPESDQFMKDFQPKEFIADGLNAYLTNTPKDNLKFSDSFKAEVAVKSTGEDGTLIVNASYDNYAFNGYEVNGTFIYELPVEKGII